MKVTRDNAEIYYQVEGPADGPAILFAHGAGGNAASWYQQVPFFRAQGYRVITFDHRGFARSRCKTEHFHPTHFEGDALAILDALGVQHTAVVCQSMGGWTGSRLAARHPQRVSSLVLGNTPGAIFSEALIEQARNMAAPRPADAVHPAISAEFAKRDPAGATLYMALSAFSTDPMPIGVLFARDSFLSEAEVTRLKQHRVLVLASEWDQLFPTALLRRTAEHIGAQFVEVPGAGHSTYFEQPAIFNRIVGEFLAPLLAKPAV